MAPIRGTHCIYRPGSGTVGFDLLGPAADLVAVEAELLETEARIAREGGRVLGIFVRVRDVVAIYGGTSFVRYVRAYIERTPTVVSASVHVERSFVVRTIVDPIALLNPRVSIRTFADVDKAAAFAREADPTFALPPFQAPERAG